MVSDTPSIARSASAFLPKSIFRFLISSKFIFRIRFQKSEAESISADRVGLAVDLR